MFPVSIFSVFQLVLKRKLSSHLNVPDRDIFRSFHLGLSANTAKHLDSPDEKPFKTNEEDVWIGPPNPVSNLRLKVFPQSPSLSYDEKNFYSKCQETQDWNQQFWEAHNKDFTESRKLYIDKVLKEKNLPKDDMLRPEDISVFYKDFLDRNRSKHITYNWNWYRRNLNLLFLAAKMNLTKFKKIIMTSRNLKS